MTRGTKVAVRSANACAFFWPSVLNLIAMFTSRARIRVTIHLEGMSHHDLIHGLEWDKGKVVGVLSVRSRNKNGLGGEQFYISSKKCILIAQRSLAFNT